MEKNSADSPLDQAIEQYKRDLMAVYRRSRTLERPDGRSSEQQPTPSAPAQPPKDPPAPTHGPDLSGQEPEKAADAPLPEPEDPDEPPENSGTPKDAIGCDEAKYLTAAGEFLRQLLDQRKPGRTPAPDTAEPETPSPTLREEFGEPPENSGTPKDAIGCDEAKYLTAAGEFLRQLLDQRKPEHTPAPDTAEPETPSPTLREEFGEPPENSGTPKDAIGCDEAKYLAAAGEFLRQLLDQRKPEHTPAPDTAEPETPSPTLREESGEPPENSGTPKDAIGCDEAKYLAAAGDFLRQLLDQDRKPTPPTGNTHHTTNDENFQPSSAIKEEYEQFQLENPASGTIKTQVFTARGAYPVEQAQVDLYKVFPEGDYLISRQYTDRSGQVNPVTVPVYQRSLSESPGDSTPYVSYRIAVTHPGFADAVIEQVPVFEGVTSLQSVNLIPMAATPSAPDDSTESN